MNRVPKLRFKEFIDEWQNIKLGMIFKEISERNLGEDSELLSVSINNGVQKRSEIDTKDNSSEDKSNYKKVKKNDIVYNTMRMWQGAVGVSYYDGIVSPAYTVVRLIANDNIKYFEYLFKTYKTIYLFKKFSQGLTSDTWNLKFDKFKEIKIMYPQLKEQQKIADFLSSVDKKIFITEEKLDLFKNYKKGIMQKIFNQELRFKDSNGNNYPEWEEKILGKIIIKNKEKNKENKYNLVQSISNKFGFVNQDEYFEDRRVASQDLKNYYVAKNKLFAYNPSRINVGSLAYKEDNNISVISPLYVSFYSNKEYLIDKFLLNWLFSLPFIKQMSCSFEGSVRNNLSFETLSNFIIQLPCLEEQQKIADFLSAIDTKIEKISDELENLKEFKKGLLQQMFV